MKKVLILIALVCGVQMAQAQWKSQTMTYSVAGDDTATNTDQILMDIPTGLSSLVKYDVNVKVAITRVSGTLAATVYCQGSNDGTNWHTLKVCSTVSPSITDTSTVANAATALASFAFQPLSFKYLRVSYNSSGTGVSAPVATIYYRKAD